MYRIYKSITFQYNCAELELTKKAKMLRKKQSKILRLSYKEHMVDALALGAEEGRDKLRKATGSCT